MPAVRSLFSLALPKLFGTTRATINSTFGSYAPGSSGNKLGPDSKNKISVKQEWTVLSEGPNDPIHERHARKDSDVELLNVGVAISGDDVEAPTRKMTLSKHGGAWRGMSVDEAEEYQRDAYKSPAFTRERELR